MKPLASASAGRRQAVVEPARQRAGFPMARLVRVLAGLVARRQFQHAQGWRAFRFAQPCGGVQGHSAAGGLGGEVENLVQAVRGRCLEHGERGGDGLADAGGRLRQHAAAARRPAPHGFGQFALAGAKLRVGKGERGQRGVALRTVRQFQACPGEELRAARLEKDAQRLRRMRFDEDCFFLRAEVQVDQRHVEAGEAARLAEQPSIDPGLGPVQVAVVGRLPREVAPPGLISSSGRAWGHSHRRGPERAACRTLRAG